MSEEQTAKFKDFLNVYEFECELPGTGQIVKFKPLTTGQLKRMLVYENVNNFQKEEEALDELIKSSVISEDFNINDLFLEDRAFLLIEIRKKTKGEVIEFTHNCTECGSQTLNRVNMNEMVTTKKTESVDNVVKLTDDISVRLKHVTRGEQKRIPRNIGKNKTRTQEIVDIQIYTMALGIESVISPKGEESNLSLADRVYLLENIPTDLFENIKNWYDDNTFGLDFNYKIVCNNCGWNETTSAPLDNFFF